jgi:hypothetical protein
MGQSHWFRRHIRGVRPDRNPLRRKSDRLETYILAGSAVAAIAAAPFAAQLASQASRAAAQHTSQAQLASSHEVTALTLQAAAGTTDGYSLQSQFPVQARWTTVTGQTRTGQIMVPPGTTKGATVPVWTNAAGQATNPPLAPGQIAGQADLGAMGAITGVALLFTCEAVIVRRTLNRRRLAAWDADWAVTAPMWNRQRW